MSKTGTREWSEAKPSFDVCPTFAPNDAADCRLANAVALAESPLTVTASGVLAANIADGLVGQLRVPVALAARSAFRVGMSAAAFSAGRAAFRFAVAGVFGIASQEKVGRIAADRIIAVVENKQTWRDRPVGYSPGHAGRPECRPPCALPQAEYAVSFGLSSGFPRPAFARPAKVDFRPEAQKVLPCEERNDKVGLTHDSLQSRGLCSERLAAQPVGRSFLRNRLPQKEERVKSKPDRDSYQKALGLDGPEG